MTQIVQNIKMYKNITELFFKLISDFGHKETGKYLDRKM